MIDRRSWVKGRDGAGNAFTAGFVTLRGSNGSTYEFAFVYRDGHLVDMDTREYLGVLEPTNSP